MIDIHSHIPLANYTTMRLGGSARYFCEVYSPQEVAEACAYAKANQLPFFVLGGGSNTIARDEDYPGLIIHTKIPGFQKVAEDVTSASFTIGAGEIWDSVVTRTVALNLSGIETMSAIPGTAGAAPVQNVGAYGQEIADTLESLVAYDSQANQFVTLSNDQCDFSYRNSIFRSSQAGRYVIVSITITLRKSPLEPPFYASLQTYLNEHSITAHDPATLRQAVIAIRHTKLPDPSQLPNTGSFFKNSLVEDWQLKELEAIQADIPRYDMGDGTYKIPSGWLIEQSGLKGKLLHGIRVYQPNALVLVNESAHSYSDLAAARKEIIDTVQDHFQLRIQQEPLEI